MKYLFIINPSAGKGAPLKYIDKIREVFSGEEYYIELTKKKGHATEIVRKYSSRGEYTIYAIGGDGTVNEVVNGMVGTNNSLVIVPAGSGNDFIRSIHSNYKGMNFLKKYDIKSTSYIDLIKINDTHFLNIASVGLDADVVYNATRFKKSKFMKGDLAYIVSLIKTIFKKRGVKVTVKVDKVKICSREILLMCMANGKYYGGGVKMMPIANVEDGKIDVCIVENLSLMKILKMVPKLIKGTHLKAKGIEVYKADEVEIRGEEPLRVNIDGEIVEEESLNIKIIPKAIKLLD